MYRKTYAEINLKNIYENVKKLVNKLSDYKYLFGVVKADCYGHDGNKVIKQVIKGGCNYLAVATLEEAIEIRKDYIDIPILCLGIINEEDLDICKKNNITITISSLEQLNIYSVKNLNGVKIHIKINTGMNRLGVSTKEEFNTVIKKISYENITIEGIYTHIYNDSSEVDTYKQIQKFKDITQDCDLSKVPIVHFGASGYSLNYPKESFVNGCRLGIAMYGLIDFPLDFKSTFSLYSKIIQINEVNEGTVGYNGSYHVNGKEKIAIVPIGYADGIIRKNSGRKVYINNKEYPIVGNICMDMLFVKVDNDVNIGDTVILIKDIEHIKQIAKHLDTISYEVICNIGKRIPRIYK